MEEIADNKEIPEEICSNCGKETTYSECHYCKKCDAALCPDCDCNKHEEEESLPKFKDFDSPYDK